MAAVSASSAAYGYLLRRPWSPPPDFRKARCPPFRIIANALRPQRKAA